MRVLFLAVIFVHAALALAPLRAAPILYEPFAYPAGDLLDGTDGAPVTAGGKTAPNGSTWFPTGYNTQTTFNGLLGTQVVNLNLTVNGLQSSAGNAVWYGGNGYPARVATGTLNSGTVFASFAFRIFDITGLPASGGSVAGFSNTRGARSDSLGLIDGSVWVRPTPDTTDTPANFNIGLLKSYLSPNVLWDSAVYTAGPNGPTQFAVTSYTFNGASNTDNQATLYLNPNPLTFGGAAPTSGTILSSTTGTDIPVVVSFMLGQGFQSGAPQGIVFDELRVGTSWADVTPAQSWSAVSPPGPMPGGPVATTSLADFQAFSYMDPQGHVMPYRLFVPQDYDPHRKYPIVISLHGGGEIGTDNIAPASYLVAQRLAARAKDPQYSSIVLVPQTDDYWGPRTQGDILDILASLEAQYSVDTNREYLTGYSAGGEELWDFIAQYPHKFAAAVPVAGGGNPASAEIIKNIPIWAYYAAGDITVPVSETRTMINALLAAGGHPRYTEFPFGSHVSSFNDAYSEPQLYQWMFSQALPEPRAGVTFGILVFIASLRRPLRRTF